jgi:hypothetical protein
MPRIIWEIYIEDTQIIINDAGGMFFCKDGPRSPVGEVFDIEIPYEIEAKLFGLINTRDRVVLTIDKLFSDIEKLKKIKATDIIE